LIVPVLVAGCTPDALGPSLRLVVANQVDSALTCSGVNDLSLPMLNASTIRITAVVRNSKMPDPMTNQGTVTAMCDISLAATSDINKTTVAYPLGSGDKVDFYAEAWDMNGQRLASGALLNQSTDAHATLPDLRMFATESFRCTAPPVNAGPTDRLSFRLAQSRAFHTATTLPNGQILIAGGLKPSTSGDAASGDMYYIDGTVEVYDPPTGTFISFMNEPGPPTPRAFHTAFLLPDKHDGTYQVALVGGVSTKTPSMAAFHDYTGEPSGFRFTPLNPANILPAGGSDNSVDVVSYDSNGKTISRTKVMGFHPTAFQVGTSLPTGGAVLAGGLTGYDVMGNPILDKHLDATDGTGASLMVRGGMLPDNRLASGMVIYSENAGTATGLIVGGIADANANPKTSPLAQVVVPSGNPTAAQLYVASSFIFPDLQFPTLTVLPGKTPNILVSGGLQVTGKLATQPIADGSASLYLISTDTTKMPMAPCVVNGMASMCPALTATAVTAAAGGYKIDPTCTADPQNSTTPHYRPVAWNAATLLPSGDRVLLTGGTARNTVNQPLCQDCPDGDNSLSCALKQSAIFRPATSEIAPITPNGATVWEQMQIPRFGHTQSILPDGKIAIIGGFTRKNAMTFGVGEVEIWNPARKLPVTDTLGDVDDPVRSELIALHVTRDPAKVGPPTSGGFSYTNCCIPGNDQHPCPN
jgi:hypothetical protein